MPETFESRDAPKQRIVHVVTYVSEDGAYGGPVSVAKAQVEELARRGHEVTLLAGWDGRAVLRVPGASVELFRARSLIPKLRFASMVAPRLWLTLSTRARNIDVLHVHLARDMVTMPAAVMGLLTRTRTFIQTHGMIIPDRRLAARTMDIATRWIFRKSSAHFVLTPQERRDVSHIEGARANIHDLPNGVAAGETSTSWQEPPLVVFCARLHPRKQVMHFLEMAELLLEEGHEIDFEIYGPDGGDLHLLQARLKASKYGNRISYLGALAPEAVLSLFTRAQALVLPSVREPYPMTVLEAMTHGCPSVVTTSNGLAPVIKSVLPALVCDDDARLLADAVTTVLRGPREWEWYSRHVQLLAQRTFGMRAVVDVMESAYAAPNSQIWTGG